MMSVTKSIVDPNGVVSRVEYPYKGYTRCDEFPESDEVIYILANKDGRIRVSSYDIKTVEELEIIHKHNFIGSIDVRSLPYYNATWIMYILHVTSNFPDQIVRQFSEDTSVLERCFSSSTIKILDYTWLIFNQCSKIPISTTVANHFTSLGKEIECWKTCVDLDKLTCSVEFVTNNIVKLTQSYKLKNAAS